MLRSYVCRNAIQKVLIPVLPRNLPHLLKIDDILEGSLLHLRIRHSAGSVPKDEGQYSAKS